MRAYKLQTRKTPSRYMGIVIFGGALFLLMIFVWELTPPTGSGGERMIRINSGDSFMTIASQLEKEGVIRSRYAFGLLGIMTGGAIKIQTGTYLLPLHASTPRILWIVMFGAHQEVQVRIPEGATIYDIDALLGERGILRPGELIRVAHSSSGLGEGIFFPDTYFFFLGSEPESVARKMKNNFVEKTKGILTGSGTAKDHILILASLLEREVPDEAERRIVAGILEKRVRVGMPLQVDATVCYAKEVQAKKSVPCDSFTRDDLKINSPYNTYLYKGWPPGPIGNPGLSAIEAALHPKTSSYWFYLSDPKTKKTIFAETLEEHNRNKARYLE